MFFKYPCAINRLILLTTPYSLGAFSIKHAPYKIKDSISFIFCRLFEANKLYWKRGKYSFIKLPFQMIGSKPNKVCDFIFSIDEGNFRCSNHELGKLLVWPSVHLITTSPLSNFVSTGSNVIELSLANKLIILPLLSEWMQCKHEQFSRKKMKGYAHESPSCQCICNIVFCSLLKTVYIAEYNLATWNQCLLGFFIKCFESRPDIGILYCTYRFLTAIIILFEISQSPSQILSNLIWNKTCCIYVIVLIQQLQFDNQHLCQLKCQQKLSQEVLKKIRNGC